MNIRPFLRRVFKKKKRTASGYLDAQKLLLAAKALEIGGPSKIFSIDGILPVYGVISELDNCNYSNDTVWIRNSVEDQKLSAIHNSVNIRNQFVLEADDLADIQSESYDAVLSSHVLEHIANPLQALMEWHRVLKPNGTLLLVVPHKNGTFDHNRPVTKFSHLIKDLESKTGIDDKTHLEEILNLHDLSLDEGVKDFEDLRIRAVNNIENRCLHHHVFDTKLVEDAVDRTGFELVHSEFYPPCHILVIAVKDRVTRSTLSI